MVESESHDEAVEKLLKESLPFSFPLYENFFFYYFKDNKLLWKINMQQLSSIYLEINTINRYLNCILVN